MADFRSKYVHEVAWDIRTSGARHSGTDSPVTVTLLRDDAPVISLNVEPGNTQRLNRGASELHWWRFSGAIFQDPDVVTWIAGLGYPDGVEFANDVNGHLKYRFRIYGDDLWQKERIDCYVRYLSFQHVPGTIDSFIWVPDLNWTHVGTFDRDLVLSTDPGEGFRMLTLNV